MKLTIAFLLLALAYSAHSSVIPIQTVLTSQVSLAGLQPLQVVVPSQALITSAPVPAVVAAPSILPAAVEVVASPPAAPVVVAAAPVQGTYVAQTLGSTHIAPLPGHANSASSVNLEPAPGTA